ncbi:ladderlectin-like [Anoplopoma fimbria]|uniref:Nattectin n=1 Tax=Anoplopoma fimbria TaxID=229290 RepID=C3KI69_ANOFI|nr:ladderlectin-like [Anoplopoma fimbria]XP_054461303.1 ladderlectin-like [Anoplopoma fimbria]ACQ58341.1 Nattectin precursor [Anoplopoma fimbria]ACQ58906.1 Nattectin precursor [Anoplopoma fimbria]
MKTLLVLSVLLCASFAAPAEDKVKAPEAAVEALKEQIVAVHAPEEAAAPESRYNFCPNGWFSHGSRCFLFVSTPMTWYSAEEHCNNLGGHLASATNPREYSFLQQMTQTAGQSIAWMGGFSLQGRWMWIDREGFYYTNWYSQSSSSSYPCIHLRSSYGWGNTQCGSAYRFICSKNPFSC